MSKKNVGKSERFEKKKKKRQVNHIGGCRVPIERKVE